MARSLFIILLALCAIAVVLGDAGDDATGEDIDIVDAEVDPISKKPRGLFVRAIGRGGKILISRRKEGREKEGRDKKAIIVEIDRVREMRRERHGPCGERDDDEHSGGDDGPREGEKDHEFREQRFNFTRLDKTANYQGISAFHFALTTVVRELRSILTVDFYFFRDNGTVTNGDESYDVTKGKMKFTVKLDECDSCPEMATRPPPTGTRPPPTSTFSPTGTPCPTGPPRNATRMGRKRVQMRINIYQPGDRKGREGARQPGHGVGGKRRPRRFELGEGGAVSISEKCEMDGVWEDVSRMSLEEKKAGYSFKLEFPSFNRTMFYDPEVEAADEAELDNGTNSSTINFMSGVTLIVMYVYSKLIN